ncbi:hypothetical protein EGW08_016709 [Elysia chlorotica]|uniref:Retrotransposon gag domain-containing protein n=1 Tax=Elysia chlorotica TaxID=188477 RepID=A0A433T1U1_ELYCH|nr:hypothetical protein EGW08_016709 [Elysia chlorotica]
MLAIYTLPRDVQVALFLHCLDDDALKTYNGFSFEQPDSQRTLSDIITKFDAFAMGEMNVTYERYLFNSRLQRERESFEIFYSDLRRLVKSCNYCERCLDSLLRDRIVLGVRDKDTQRDLLSRDLTLAKAIDVCKVAENADRHRQKINMAPEASAAVNALPKQRNRPLSSSTRPQSSSKPPQAAKCKFCGRQHLMLKSVLRTARNAASLW